MFFITFDDVRSRLFTGFLWSTCGPFTVGPSDELAQIDITQANESKGFMRHSRPQPFSAIRQKRL
jgi:hypothetical protein